MASGLPFFKQILVNDFNKSIEDFDYENYSVDHIVRAAQLIFLNKT